MSTKSATTGQNVVVTTVDAGFAYTYGQTWAPGWSVTIADLDGDRRSDVFLYNATDGRWFEVFVDPPTGGYRYVGGEWGPNWTIIPTPTPDGATALLLYNAVLGKWFRAMPSATGFSSFVEGVWTAGLTVIPM